MIYYLSGNILTKKEKYLVVLVNNIGYKVFVAQKNLKKVSEKAELFCFLNVREKGMELYGCLSEKELEFFELLEGLKGIGPKVALEIAAIGDPEEVKKRIIDQEPTVFEGIVGLGAKRKASLTLELSGKVKQFENKKTEEEQALTSLGFSLKQSREALNKVDQKLSPEEKIKEALKTLGQK